MKKYTVSELLTTILVTSVVVAEGTVYTVLAEVGSTTGVAPL